MSASSTTLKQQYVDSVQSIDPGGRYLRHLRETVGSSAPTTTSPPDRRSFTPPPLPPLTGGVVGDCPNARQSPPLSSVLLVTE